MTFDLDLWPTDLNINRGHLLIKDYLPTKFEGMGQSVLELSVAQGEVNWHDLWPTDLNINRDHLLTKGYLPTKFEASGAKRSWVISCPRWSKLAWPLTLTFDLLTWKSIGIIYELWVISCTRWSKLAWPLPLTFDLLTWKSIGIIYSPRTIYTYQVWSFWGKAFLSYQLPKVK